MGCSTSFAKLILFIFNVAFFIFGIASLGVGIWVAVSKNKLFEFINLLDSNVGDNSSKQEIDAISGQTGLIVIAAYVLIFVGAFTLIVGFCGCCGAMKESTILLNIYAVLVGLVLLIEVLVAVLAAVFQSRIRGGAEKAIYKLQDKYYVSLPTYLQDVNSGKAAVTYLLNFVQVQFECCGAGDVNDIRNSSSWLSSDRTWEGRNLTSPVTCCKLKPNLKQEVLSPSYNWSSLASALADPNCPFEPNSNQLHQKRCYDGVMGYVGQYSVPLIGVCVAIALLELLGIVFACCLVNALRNS